MEESINKNYYNLRCPYCDKEIKHISNIKNGNIHCYECEKDFTLYQVISYNMWLAENNKATKVESKPKYFESSVLDELPPQLRSLVDIIKKKYNIDDVNIIKYDPHKFEKPDQSDKENNYNSDTYEDLSDSDLELFEDIHNETSGVASICFIQYNYLRLAGFNDRQAMHILDKLIEKGFIGGLLDE